MRGDGTDPQGGQTAATHAARGLIGLTLLWLMLVLGGCDLEAVGALIPADLPEPHDPAGHNAIEASRARPEARQRWTTDPPAGQVTRALFVQHSSIH